MASEAFAGVGTKFQRWDGAAWQDIAEVNSIDGPGMTKDVLEVTSLDTDAGYNEFITGFAEGGTVTLDMNFTRETYELMKDDFESDVVQNYRIQLDDYDSEPSTFTFGGLVIELPMGISADDKVTADVVIQVTSQVILDIGSTVPAEESETPPVEDSSGHTYGAISATKYATVEVNDFGGDASDNTGYLESRFYYESGSGLLVLFCVANKYSSTIKFHMYISANYPYFEIQDAALRTRFNGTTAITTGWHTLRVSSDGSAFTMTLDGTPLGKNVSNGSDDGRWLMDIAAILHNVSIGADILFTPVYSADGNNKIDYVDYNNEHYWDLDDNTGVLVDEIGSINLLWS